MISENNLDLLCEYVDNIIEFTKIEKIEWIDSDICLIKVNDDIPFQYNKKNVQITKNNNNLILTFQ